MLSEIIRNRYFRTGNSMKSVYKFTTKSACAVQIHIYYTDLLDEILSYINNIKINYDCYITTDDKNKARVIYDKFTKNCHVSQLEIMVLENRGRDIGPFLIQMQDVALEYDIMLHIHTKKALTSTLGDGWRQYLFKSLLGSSVGVKKIIAAFKKDGTVGLVYPDIYPPLAEACAMDPLGGNSIASVEDAMCRLNIPLMDEWSKVFPAGNMLWFRPKAVKQLFMQKFTMSDFPTEAGQTRGTIMHVLERLWNKIAEYNGFKALQCSQNNSNTIREYDNASKNIQIMRRQHLPLVSVVIPIFCQPVWFEQALKSVLNQTYKNIEIFITDNSSDTRTKELMQKYLKEYPNIIYEHHPSYTSKDNSHRCRAYNNPKAEYVNYLMDDDLFMPDKIEFMIEKFLHYPQLALVTSYRQYIDGDGNVLPDNNLNKSIIKQDTIYPGKNIGQAILYRLTNFVGEPTTALIKKSCLKNGTLGSRISDEKHFITDFPTWLYCMERGDLYYCVKPLSQFRKHSGQQQKNKDVMAHGLCRWAMELLHELDTMHFFNSRNEFLKPSELLFNEFGYYISKIEQGEKYDPEIAADIVDLMEKMVSARQQILAE